jgi:hypothetical protein
VIIFVCQAPAFCCQAPAFCPAGPFGTERQPLLASNAYEHDSFAFFIFSQVATGGRGTLTLMRSQKILENRQLAGGFFV